MKTRKICGLVLASLLPCTFLSVSSLHPSSDAKVSPELEKAALVEDWQTVVALCGPNDQLVASPVKRALKGHASLALNRNNEALLLFLSINNDSDRQVYLDYTFQLSQTSHQSHVAYYLKGDAHARLGQWNLAIKSFSRALHVKPTFALALNGRGVVYAYNEEWDNAKNDFEMAFEVAPSFVDAYTSFGTLLVLKKAPKGAELMFNKALALSEGTALAINGRACAEYALIKWEDANEDFARAGREMALPLFLANLRGLAVAAEKAQLPGLENSPLFRVTDFLDWEGLQKASLNENDLLRWSLGDVALPETLSLHILHKLNNVLENPQFYAHHVQRIGLEDAGHALLRLIEETKELRDMRVDDFDADEKKQILVFNRMLFEHVYPLYIAKHSQRDPGTQLTLTQGFVNQLDYKKSLAANQIVMGQATMDYLGRPLANMLEVSKLPPLVWVGKQLNDHLDFSTETNRMAMRDNWGMELDSFRPGGVLIAYRRKYVDHGDWPVTNWFGLAYVAQ